MGGGHYPERTAPVPDEPATEKQIAYIRGLRKTRSASDNQEAWFAVHPPSTISKREASRMIDEMNQWPLRGDVPQVLLIPPGRYALLDKGVTKFYVVDRPTSGRWAGSIFVSAQASDDLHPLKNPTLRNKILGRIARDPRTASERYGRELGVCGVCGRTLTDETSRANGIGPVCAEREGWK